LVDKVYDDFCYSFVFTELCGVSYFKPAWNVPYALRSTAVCSELGAIHNKLCALNNNAPCQVQLNSALGVT
jgi:hypothetical protein